MLLLIMLLICSQSNVGYTCYYSNTEVKQHLGRDRVWMRDRLGTSGAVSMGIDIYAAYNKVESSVIQ